MSTAIPTALVTGGALRLGAAIVRALHQQGYHTLVHCNESVGPAQQLCASLNGVRENSSALIRADLANEASMEQLQSEVLANYSGLSLLVNNASVFSPGTLAATSRQLWRQHMRVNVEAPYFLVQSFAERLAQNTGSVVNITDIYAERPLSEYAAYCASKAALLSVTRSLAQELAPRVRVNAIAPGAILWPEVESSGFSEQLRERYLSRVPMGKLGQPEDIAQAVVFLADQAPYLTGEVIHVDGGQLSAGQ